MKNGREYNAFVRSLEKDAEGGLFFHHVQSQIVITDIKHTLLGVWDLEKGSIKK